MSVMGIGYFTASFGVPGILRIFNILPGIGLLAYSILLILGKNPIEFIGKAYLKIENNEIKYKSSPTSRKIVRIDINEIEKIIVNLFSVKVLLNDQSTIHLDLNNLSDENLKLVKSTFRSLM